MRFPPLLGACCLWLGSLAACAGGRFSPGGAAGSAGEAGGASQAGSGGAAGEGASGGRAGSAQAGAGAGGDGGTCGDKQTSSKNCGSCGHDCLGGACVAGACQPLLLTTFAGNHIALTVEANAIYVVDQNTNPSPPGNGAVWKLPKDGSAPVQMVAPGNADPIDLALNSDFLFVSDVSGALLRIDKTSLNLEQFQAPINGAGGVTVKGGKVFWTTLDRVFAHDVTNVSAQTIEVAQAQSPRDVDHNDNTLYWINEGTDQPKSGAILSTPLPLAAQPSPVLLVGGLDRPQALRVDDTHAYFLSANAVMRVSLSETSPTPEIVGPADPDSPSPTSLALDDSHVYWVTSGLPDGATFKDRGSVRRVHKKTKEVAVLAAHQLIGLGRVAIDDKAIYWTTSDSGGVYRLAK